MFKRTPRIKLIAASTMLVASFAIASVASASAATLYVSSTAPVVTNGRSCAQPDYSTVQAAISAGGARARIMVCPGRYTEQLEITQGVTLTAVNGAGTATIAMPEHPASSKTSCDGSEQFDEVAICGSETVSITNLSVEAIIPLETCTGSLDGIFVAGGATLKATGDTVDGASTSLDAYKGCQHGIAVYVGSARTPEQVGNAILKNVTVSGYEKNGPTVGGKGSTMTITGSNITGEGASPYIGQNGVQVAYGAKGTIKSTTVAGNECDVASCGATGEQASGVLFYQAAPGSAISNSLVKENDEGVYYSSGSATQPSGPEVTLTKDVLESNRYEGVEFEEGDASMRSDTIDGSGRVGIDLYQAGYQQSSSDSSSTGTKISGQSEAAIKVESDKSPADKPGKFTFSHGTATGNGTVLINESSNFEVVF